MTDEKRSVTDGKCEMTDDGSNITIGKRVVTGDESGKTNDRNAKTDLDRCSLPPNR